jgi:hypothetical protein
VRERKNAYGVMMGKPNAKILVGNSREIWEENIKIYVKNEGLEGLI